MPKRARHSQIAMRVKCTGTADADESSAWPSLQTQGPPPASPSSEHRGREDQTGSPLREPKRSRPGGHRPFPALQPVARSAPNLRNSAPSWRRPPRQPSHRARPHMWGVEITPPEDPAQQQNESLALQDVDVRRSAGANAEDVHKIVETQIQDVRLAQAARIAGCPSTPVEHDVIAPLLGDAGDPPCLVRMDCQDRRTEAKLGAGIRSGD
mmetsp:Transcript_77981/g.218780  ORF Transcript_77981/g.218780 Transcript_77981/m.218780 type:complete len:210 (+) Transcript_77981:618-1247(+)